MKTELASASWTCTYCKWCMSTLGLCGAARWQKSQMIKSNMFTEGENVWMEAGVEMTAPCWEKTNVTQLRDEQETRSFILLSESLI